MRELLWSFSEAGKILGINRQSVSDLVRVMHIVPKKTMGHAKGLNEADIRLIGTTLGIVPDFSMLAVA